MTVTTHPVVTDAAGLLALSVVLFDGGKNLQLLKQPRHIVKALLPQLQSNVKTGQQSTPQNRNRCYTGAFYLICLPIRAMYCRVTEYILEP